LRSQGDSIKYDWAPAHNRRRSQLAQAGPPGGMEEGDLASQHLKL
jgi:hypothetical protein